MERLRLTMYSRPNCPLCDEARELIEELGDRFAFSFEEVDITADPALYERYRHRIPVIALNGQDAVDPPVTHTALLAALRTSQRGAR